MNDQSRIPSLSYGIQPQGYRLPDETRLGLVSLQVSNLKKSLDYYEQVLELRVLERTEVYAALGVHGEDVQLVELHELSGAEPVPRRGRLGLYHFAILLPDRASLGRFVAHLARGGVRAGASHHRVSEALYLQDPDGLGIEVYADLPREEWEAEDGQLVMATDPLDLDSVISAAGGEPWTGMPAGTVIGHVHLHVGEIPRATDFYHEALGLDKTVWNYPGALFLSAGGYHHHLGVNTWAAGAEPVGPGDARLLEWQIFLPSHDEVHRASESLTAAGFEVDVEGSAVLVADPWGTKLRIQAAPA